LIRSDKQAIRQIFESNAGVGHLQHTENRSRYGNAMVAKMPNQIDVGHVTPTSVCWAEAPSSCRLTVPRSTGMARIAGLTEEERDLIRRRDWRGLMHYGAIFFMLEKLGAVSGVSNLHIYAAMRGESLEVFQRTRNAPGALYSVAGKGTGNLGWDQPAGTANQG
jgi:hypothetical protein